MLKKRIQQIVSGCLPLTYVCVASSVPSNLAGAHVPSSRSDFRSQYSFLHWKSVPVSECASSMDVLAQQYVTVLRSRLEGAPMSFLLGGEGVLKEQNGLPFLHFSFVLC